ncbi:transcription factor LHW-like [Canna indica]|uniref:Transcription factor LHW-like n=1 Tax=Canna indica TaxID=4628 RepID=A0AAQ3KLR3_9LILI|nr:transcription factor LHW-like [Canna indica]
MAPQLRAALAALCRRHGWSYAVVWRVDRRDPRLLVVEESYCQEQVGLVVENMLNRVHMVGEGTVGESMIIGKDEWIFHDSYDTDSCSSQDIADLVHQFMAGIKTILITSRPSSGVVQFGSTNKIPESLEFIDQAKHLFQLMESMSEPSSHVGHLNKTKIDDQHDAFACTISAADIYCGHENTPSLHGNNREKMIDPGSVEGPSQSSIILPSGSSHRFRPQYNMSPRELSLTSSFSGSSIHFNKPLHRSISRNSVLYLEKQDGATSDEAHRSIIDQGLLSAIGGPEMSNLFRTNSCILSHENALHQFCADSSPSSRQYKWQDSMPEARPPAVSDSCISVSEKQPFLPQEVCNANPICDVPSFAPELLGTSVANLQESIPEYSSLLHTKDVHLIHLTDQQPEQMNEKGLALSSVSSTFGGKDAIGCNRSTKKFRTQVENFSGNVSSPILGNDAKAISSTEPSKLSLDYELFDGMEFDPSANNFMQQYWDDIIMPAGSGNCSNLSVSVAEHLSEMQMGPTLGATKGSNSESSLEQLLHAIVGQTINENSSQGFLAKNGHHLADPCVENHFSTVTSIASPSVYKNQIPSVCLPSFSQTSNVLLPYRISEVIHGSTREAMSKSNVGSWIDDCCSMNNEGSVLTQPKKAEEGAKVKKRARPGESTRPRPKDRQQIQDRVKELREIVPNGAKCSIDALLDRTIKHMLFLQSVTKYADKLKQADEPKMIVEESGVVLKDSSSGSSTGGTTWAYEVAGQTMVCPIMVEDLTPPGQMLVEMLCEERGIFLEIADIIRGFGLTILKGVMEIRERKIWARFLVEANRDVTRLDIFLSLIQLLQQNGNIQSSEQTTNVLEKGDPVLNYQQSPISI